MLHRLSFILTLFIVSVAAHDVDKVYIDPHTRSVRDAHHRHIIFHGVNVVYKVPPYIPDE